MRLSARARFASGIGAARANDGHLAQRVHACVRASRALGQHVFARDSGQRVAQFALHRHPAGLHLPAVKVGTVIGKHQLPYRSVVRLPRTAPEGRGYRNQCCDILAQRPRSKEDCCPRTRTRMGTSSPKVQWNETLAGSVFPCNWGQRLLSEKRAKTRVIGRPCRICHASSLNY